MQRLPIAINTFRNKVKFSPTLSIKNFTTEIHNDNKSEDNKKQGDSGDQTSKNKLGGFAVSFDKFNKLQSNPEPIKNRTFENMLRHSKFMDLGDPEGKVVTGRIFHVVENDLYIDFGWKFHCVCTRPLKNGSDYVRGADVKIMIKNLELSTRFLGAVQDLTILEADCILLGLINTPMKNVTSSL